MPAYTSPILRLRLSALGEDLNSWGDPNLNNAFYRIEEALGSILTLTITGDRTLTSDNFVANEYRRHALILTGSPAADFTITVPAISYPYRIINRTGRQATIKTAAGAAAIVRVGASTTVLCDGTDCTALDPTLDQIKTAAGPVSLGGQRLTNGADGVAATDFVTVQQAPALVASQVQLASDWAQKTSGSVDGGSGYSARAWATSTTILTGGFKGALGYANDASSSATAAGTSATNAASSAGAASTSATNAATSATNAGTSATNSSNSAALSQQWATSTMVVSGGFKGAYGYAQDASASASSAQAAVGSVKVSATDTTAAALQSKLIAGSGITLNRQNPGGNETLQIISAAGGITRVVRTSNTQLVATDKGAWYALTGTFTQTFDTPANLVGGTASWSVYLENAGSGQITIPSSDGVTSWIMYPGEVRIFFSDGTTLVSRVLHPFYATFITSGSFVKPPSYYAFGGLQWSGGAGGISNGASVTGTGYGGGGGYCMPLYLLASALGASTSFTVAGTSAAVPDGTSANGNNSTFGGITVFGGATPSSGAAFSGAFSSTTSGTRTVYDGGNSALNPNTIYGGAAGGTANNNSTVLAPGTSALGGNGGAASLSGTASSGTAPGGGGGGSYTGTGGAGARGELRLWGIV